MISHDRAQELISARMDAPLTAGEHRELQGHLAICDACRLFVAHADDLARGLQGLPLLAPSPAVRRAVMAAVTTDTSGWGWLRGALQALSSPGLAVASGLVLVIAMAGALMLAINGPSGGLGTDPEGTIAAVAFAPLPTETPDEMPTEIPTLEPTATRPPVRTVAPQPTSEPARTPTPRPTATQPPIVEVAEPVNEPIVAPSAEEPIIEPAAEEPVLAMAPEESAASGGSAEMAQIAEPVQTDEVQAAPEAPAENGDGNEGRRSGDDRRGGGEKESEAAAVSEPVASDPLPVPDEAVEALENAGGNSNLLLPPAPVLPMPPAQEFLPITPTPVGEASPTPDPNASAEAPQLAEEWSGELAVTALLPEDPEVTTAESDEIERKKKRDKSDKAGESRDQQQTAFLEEPLAWSAQPIMLEQAAVLPQTTDEPVPSATVAAGETSETALTTEPAPQIDPATGLQIDPATGLLIDPATGYLLDLVNNRIIHPATGYVVDPFTGLLVDPATGALLDPVTLAIVVPAGFGSDTPAYVPGDGAMRGTIEGVVDDTYDDATYKVIPATDGPVQPVDEIIVPTESGDALEIS